MATESISTNLPQLVFFDTYPIAGVPTGINLASLTPLWCQSNSISIIGSIMAPMAPSSDQCAVVATCTIHPVTPISSSAPTPTQATFGITQFTQGSFRNLNIPNIPL